MGGLIPMIGVALEGGGARGAFHVGAMKALYENGYAFDGYVGTSIGALNAAVLAQGDFDRLARMWGEVTPQMLFSDPVVWLLGLGERSPFTGDLVADVGRLVEDLRRPGGRRGVDTTRMKAMIADLVDEPRLRASGKLYGLVTVCVNELRPYQLLLGDIPEGALHSYVMASAAFPGFQPEVIGKNTFVDGGLYNNCPMNLLTDGGFDEVIAIRTVAPGLYRLPRTDAKITVITPSRDLGNIMAFDNALAARNMRIGYLDTLRFLWGLRGQSYYVLPDHTRDAGQLLMALPDSLISDLRGAFPLPDLPPQRLLFERVLPELGAYLRLSKGYDYGDLAVALLEVAAADAGVDPLRVFSLPALSQAILNATTDGMVSTPEKGRLLEIRESLLGDYRPVARQMGCALARVAAG